MSADTLAMLRREVFDHYGWFCACCGTTVNLSIDHVNGDGKQHREIIGKRSLWRWLADNGFPDGYQVLCRPCNSSKNTEQKCKIHGDMFSYEIGKRVSIHGGDLAPGSSGTWRSVEFSVRLFAWSGRA